jgi:hypothetical protein
LLPQSHVAYTWLALSLAQEARFASDDMDYRLVALAAMGPDLIDKPLALAYFYKRYRAAVLFAHTLIANLVALYFTLRGIPARRSYGVAFLGHALLDRLWFFPDTFYWPFRGWRFHVWRKQGSEQEKIGNAYWYAFTRRPELWIWELGGLLAFACFVWRRKLYRWDRLVEFVLRGRVVRE